MESQSDYSATVSVTSKDSDGGNVVPEKNVIDMSSHKFRIPEKQIRTPADVGIWEKSQAYSDILGFILSLNDAMKNKKISDDCHISPVVEKLLSLLDQLDTWIGEIPPIDQPQRFGNKAFRTWFNKLKEEGPGLLKAALPAEFEPSVQEMSTYLVEGVGNDTRIDYGTGHELSFIAFLCCLCKVGAFKEDDYPALGLRVFERYLNVMRRLQLTYRMEPAGSHGVWSLDDYQFLPFLLGSSQFIDHARIKPKSFPNQDIYEGFYKDYLFLSAIKFINQVKTGPFAEHSNQLWGISGVATWSKVNSGLIKMYRVEVLGKFPIIQHMMFGSLLALTPAAHPVPPVSAPAQSSAGIMAREPSSGGVPYGTRMPPPPAGGMSGVGTRMPPPPTGVMPGMGTRMPSAMTRMPELGTRMPPPAGKTPGTPVMPAQVTKMGSVAPSSGPPLATQTQTSASASASNPPPSTDSQSVAPS